MNQLRIQTALDYHRNIIRLIGFRYSVTDRNASIMTEIAEINLLNFVKSKEFQNQNIVESDLFRSLIDNIIEGMVRQNFK